MTFNTRFARLVLATTLGVSSLPALVGCETLNGRPEPPINNGAPITKLSANFNPDTAIADYYLPAATPETQKHIRNRLITEGMALTDLRFYEFVEEFSALKKGGDTATEIGSLTLNGIAATIDVSSTTAVLSAIAGGLTASNASFNKNYFYENAIPVLLKAMEAQRLTASVPLLDGKTKSADEYPLGSALGDLWRYYTAGTVEGSLDAIADQTSKQKDKAEINIEKIKADVAGAVRGYEAWIAWINEPVDPPAKSHAERARALLLGRLDSLSQFDATLATASMASGGAFTPPQIQQIFGNANARRGDLDVPQLSAVLDLNNAEHLRFIASVLGSSTIAEMVPKN